MKCTRRAIVSKNPDYSQHVDSEVETKALDKTTKDKISWKTIFYANQMSRTIALFHRDFESWPPTGTHFQSPDEASYEDFSRKVTLVAITGIEDPLRPNIRDLPSYGCHRQDMY
jgi:Ca2+-transporting ATPase